MSDGLCVGTWVEIHECEQQLREFHGEVVRMEGSTQQFKIDGSRITTVLQYTRLRRGFPGDCRTTVSVKAEKHVF